jgi:post-segregation antitoxin (ccd killing protein)
MPRMQVYLPEELHRQVKQKGLAVSEILQEALREELTRREKLAAIDEYLQELAAEVGEPTAEDYARAESLAARIRGEDTLPEVG